MDAAPIWSREKLRRVKLAITTMCTAAGPRPTLSRVLHLAFEWTLGAPLQHSSLHITLHTNNVTCLQPLLATIEPPPRVHVRTWEAELKGLLLSHEHFVEWNRTLYSVGKKARPIPDLFIYLEDDIELTAEALDAWWRDSALFDAVGLRAAGFTRDFYREERKHGRVTASDLKWVRQLTSVHPGCNASACVDTNVCIRWPLVAVRSAAPRESHASLAQPAQLWRIFLLPSDSYSGAMLVRPDDLARFLAFKGRRYNFARYKIREFASNGHQYSSWADTPLPQWVATWPNFWLSVPRRGPDDDLRALVPVTFDEYHRTYAFDEAARLVHASPMKGFAGRRGRVTPARVAACAADRLRMATALAGGNATVIAREVYSTGGHPVA